MKKLLSVVLSVAVIISCVAFITVSADEAAEGAKTEYVITHTSRYGDNILFEKHNNDQWINGYSYTFDDGKIYTCIRLRDKGYAKFNFLNSKNGEPFQYPNVSTGYKGVEPGYYDIQFFYPVFNAKDDPAASVEVFHNGEKTELTLNYKQCKAGEWNPLSTEPLYFAGTGDEYVKISTKYYELTMGSIKLSENAQKQEEAPEVTQPVVEDKEETKPVVATKPLISDVTFNTDSMTSGTMTLVTNGSTLKENKNIHALVIAYTYEGAMVNIATTTIPVAANSKDTTVNVNLPLKDLGHSEFRLFLFDSEDKFNLIDSYKFRIPTVRVL